MKLLYEGNRGFDMKYRIKKLDFPLHIHNAVEIFLFTAGESTVQYGEESVRLSKGDAFVSFPNQVHGYRDSVDIEGYLFILPVKPYLSPFYNTLTKKVPVRPYLKENEWDRQQILALSELAYRDLPSASETVMQGYLMAIFGKLLDAFELTEVQSGTDEMLRKIVQYLDEHYREPLTRSSVAEAVGYNESHISHIFSRKLKTTLPEYINSLRVYDATKLLMETNLSVTDIASTLSFGSVRNFNRVFLKETGRSPREYRSAVRAHK